MHKGGKVSDSSIEQRIIQKDHAVFWMDKDGHWQNEHGRFEHPKLIRFFHESIQKDENGYFVFQKTDQFQEKVYFNYEDTAVFVFDISIGKHIRLLLNTGDKIGFEQGRLIQKGDCLYLDTPEHRIKFSQNTLMKLSRYLKDTDGSLTITIDEQSWKVLKADNEECEKKNDEQTNK
jgi:hypothetical protein